MSLFTFEGWKNDVTTQESNASIENDRADLLINVTEISQNGVVNFKFSEAFKSLQSYSDMGLNLTSVNENIKDVISVVYRCVGED